MLDPPAINIAAPEPTAPTESEPPAKVMNQIRKWGCHFDGKDPVSFLERIEELQAEYGYDGALLLRGLPEMLRGDALLWYRNNRTAWGTWQEFLGEFREYYLPRRYFSQLRRDIQARTQAPDEPYRKYATDVLTMMRRDGSYVEEEQLDFLYDNMHPRYKLYVRRDDVHRATELLRRISSQCRERQSASKPSANSAATAYDKNECCWWCNQRGHTRFECRRATRKFCSLCGKDNIQGVR
ncbi:activity-regulated cytoskeleton associated protein 2-like [Solenopsis invicta]|uniref:activity-regulated cytoskeleton associated protein 2-like n=1 Tax=Solenopsis invicta TaxID=13686 RepID=UPI00193CF6B3|nr:activity-regulated cytoskeleton associated protein 2-like [Solenopsis invicta]